MSLAIRHDLHGVTRLARRIEALGRAETVSLMEGLGAELETQTHRRIRDEKQAPDGTAWEPWTDKHAATRHGGQSLLMGEGDLDDSIQSAVSADQVETGSNLIYAAIHQLGGTSDMPAGPAAIPAREYLGLSDDNLADLQAVVDDWADDQLQEMAR